MRASCVVRRPSTLENKYSNIFIYITTGPTVLQFHMEHDLTPGSQNYKIGSGRISKMAAVIKISKNNKINFFSRTTIYFWLTGKNNVKIFQNLARLVILDLISLNGLEVYYFVFKAL